MRNWDVWLCPLGFIAIGLTLSTFGFIHDINWLELIGAFICLPANSLVKRENILGIAIYFMSNVMLMFYCYHIGLFANSLGYLFYSSLNIPVILFWLRRDKCDRTKPELRPANIRPWMLAATIMIVAIAAVVGFLVGGTVGAFDYIVAGAFIMSTLLLMRKKTQGWLFMLIGDAFSIPLYIMTGSFMLLCLSLPLAAIDYAAYSEWRKMKNPKKTCKA